MGAEPFSPLTSRQIEVLELWVQGLSAKEIAQRLVVAEDTVNSHLLHVRNNLGVTTTRQAAFKAVELGLVNLPTETSTGDVVPKAPNSGPSAIPSSHRLTTAPPPVSHYSGIIRPAATELSKSDRFTTQSLVKLSGQSLRDIVVEAIKLVWEDVDETLDLLIMAACLERDRKALSYDSPIVGDPVFDLLWNFVRQYRCVANAVRSYDPRGWAAVVKDKSSVETLLSDASFLYAEGQIQALELFMAFQREFAVRSEGTIVPAPEDEAAYDWNVGVGTPGVIQARVDIEAALSLIEGLLFPDSHDPYFGFAQWNLELLLARCWDQQAQRDALPVLFSKSMRLLSLCHVGMVVSEFRPSDLGGFFLSWADYINRLFGWNNELQRTTRWLAIVPDFRKYEQIVNKMPLPRSGAEAEKALVALCPSIRDLSFDWVRRQRRAEVTSHR
ncbi:MAG: helix-turn-helix transcriptional regulator [Chloroflexi bacterium]|nr:helix-turn-helix transcriptional regulator [Chloroflexota bacterium]